MNEWADYDPLIFWNDHQNQRKYPEMMMFNKFILGYCSTSVFQECVFSCAKRVLSSHRRNLVTQEETEQGLITMTKTYKTKDYNEL